MHTQSREAAVRYGKQMPASRVVINTPTTHGAIGLSTDLPPSMTLGCGSWGGNVTSDNVSPLHLMDIKRVAFETKPVSISAAAPKMARAAEAAERKLPKREQIAAIVDSFLSKKLAEGPAPEVPMPVGSRANTIAEPETSVKTVIHEFKPQNPAENGASKEPVDFVSETDVRTAIDKGAKIYINSKTILTPAARDLGEEKDVFAKG